MVRSWSDWIEQIEKCWCFWLVWWVYLLWCAMLSCADGDGNLEIVWWQWGHIGDIVTDCGELIIKVPRHSSPPPHLVTTLRLESVMWPANSGGPGPAAGEAGGEYQFSRCPVSALWSPAAWTLAWPCLCLCAGKLNDRGSESMRRPGSYCQPLSWSWFDYTKILILFQCIFNRD